jgi:hypothetical protein
MDDRLSPNRCASLGVIRIEHSVFRRVGMRLYILFNLRLSAFESASSAGNIVPPCLI